MFSLVLLAALAATHAKHVHAAPHLLSQPFLESPVHGAADDLLVLSGSDLEAGDTVVYLATSEGAVPVHPVAVPPVSSAVTGVAKIVDADGAPNALSVRLPAALSGQQPYALWVRDTQGRWSNPVRINDARPLWFSPAYLFATQATGGLAREFKVVGRNLKPLAGGHMYVRLAGPQTITLGGVAQSDAVDGYVVLVSLPASLAAGSYAVAVSRDRLQWLTLPDALTVRPDAPAAPVFPVSASANGGCRPNNGSDESPCILRAIAAAAKAGGGTVTFDAGVWELIGRQAAVNGWDGFLLPPGVNIQGAGAGKTRIIRHADWNGSTVQPVFVLTGHNRVSGVTFSETPLHQPGDAATPVLQVGQAFYRVPATDPTQRVVDDVTITGNTFDRVVLAMRDGGIPMRHVFITNNTFGAYASDIDLGGNLFDMVDAFAIDDSVIANNLFAPGSYIDVAHRDGVQATELGASRHLDFSHNTADGTSTAFLNAPTDPRGWRAAYFWHLQSNHEESLISDNTASCTGDKVGDGEAFAFDNNANTFAFDSARTVVSATADTVTVAGPLVAQQNGHAVPLSTYYVGHWLQIGEGEGTGQVRKITGYQLSGQLVTFTVSPAWDVVPQANVARASVGREFWQVYLVGNTIDHRKPPCLKSNRSDPKGGAISVWGQTADSVIDGNQQYDADGILFLQSYSAHEGAGSPYQSWSFFQSALDIRNNMIDGEYNWDDDCSSSGIQGANSASDTPSSPPPTVAFGVSIAHNTIIHADGVHGGAISVPLAWLGGPAPGRWPMVDGTLVHHNIIRDVGGAPASRACGSTPANRRVGINMRMSQLASHTVLYQNACQTVALPIDPGGNGTVALCVAGASGTCECSSSTASPVSAP